MKQLITITVVCCLISTCSFSQSVNRCQMVGFGCYRSGSWTKTVEKFSELLNTENYQKISECLKSNNSGKKYLAVITLKKLSEVGKYQLNDSEKKLIEKASRSKALVSVCSGCTYFEKVPLKTLLTEKNVPGADHWISIVIKD